MNLDISAKILIGDPNVDRTESSKFKSKSIVELPFISSYCLNLLEARHCDVICLIRVYFRRS